MSDTINNRIRELRKTMKMTQKDFGEKIEVAQTYLSQIENGERDVTDKIAKIIILQNWNGKTVNEKWLKTGKGQMFFLPEDEDETAAYISDLLEDDPENPNPLYTIIKEIMHTYNELSPKSQEAFCEFSTKFLENIKKKGS